MEPYKVESAPMVLKNIDEVTEGDQLPVVNYSLTRGDLVNYAGVSGDPNPIHFSDLVVQALELPGVLAHGMLTMGLSADYITKWTGSPVAIKDLSVRFSNPLVVPADKLVTLDISAKVGKVDVDQRQVELLLDVRSQDTKIFGKAIAQVQL